MGCDYIQESCLEITWTDGTELSKTNETTNPEQVDYYVLEDYTKYLYFQTDDLSTNILELEIKFTPVSIISDGQFNHELEASAELQELSSQLYSSFQISNWLKKYLLDWANPNVLLEDIANSTYIKNFKPRIISGIRLIKRNCYLGKYYY